MNIIWIYNPPRTTTQKAHRKRQSTDASTKMAQMLELPDKDFKAAIIKMLQWGIINSWKNEKE